MHFVSVTSMFRYGWILPVSRFVKKHHVPLTRLDDLLEVLLDAPNVGSEVQDFKVESVLRLAGSGNRITRGEQYGPTSSVLAPRCPRANKEGGIVRVTAGNARNSRRPSSSLP